jgi:hypothetical protein
MNVDMRILKRFAGEKNILKRARVSKVRKKKTKKNRKK